MEGKLGDEAAEIEDQEQDCTAERRCHRRYYHCYCCRLPLVCAEDMGCEHQRVNGLTWLTEVWVRVVRQG